MVGMAQFAQVRVKDAQRFPGPGSYTAKDSFGPQSGTLHKSIARKIPIKTYSGTGPVGPGDYEIKAMIGQFNNFRKVPVSEEGGDAASGGTSPRSETSTKRARKNHEGVMSVTNPKQYHMAQLPDGPQYSILGKPKNSNAIAVDSHGGPGPGAYTLSSTLKRNGVSVLSKAEDIVPDETPGPGGYDIRRFGDNPPKPAPPAAPKTFPPKAGVPGPGSYECRNNIAEHCKPKANRIAFTSTFPGRNFLPDPTPIGPGPAGYALPATDFDVFTTAGDKPINHLKGATIFSRHVRSGELDAIFPQPGPAEYVIPDTFDGNKAITISRRIPQPPDKLNTPGPGGYDEHRNLSETVTGKNFPGLRFNGSRGFTKNVAPLTAESPEKPGPTTYEYHNFDIAGSPRSSKAFSIQGRDGTNIFVSNADIPGPGTYNIKESAVIPFHGGGITFHKGQFNLKRDDLEPGPGAFDGKQPQTARAWTMGKRAYDNW